MFDCSMMFTPHPDSAGFHQRSDASVMNELAARAGSGRRKAKGKRRRMRGLLDARVGRDRHMVAGAHDARDAAAGERGVTASRAAKKKGRLAAALRSVT